jgi:hypothetical protein
MFARKLRDGLLATAAAGALVMGAGSAHAASSAGVLWPGVQQLSDNSAEILINGAVVGATPTTVDVGDRLRGILDIQTTEAIPGGSTNQFGANGNNELTAIFDIIVTSKTTFGVGGCLSAFCFTFGPYSGFEAEVETVAGGGWTDGTGAMIAFWDDAVVDFTRTSTVPVGEASATGGTPFWLFGIADATDFWIAGTTTDDIAGLFVPPANGGTFNAGLTLLDRQAGPDLNPVDCLLGLASVHACASGSVAAPQPGSGFDVWDNVDITINVVPEPASLGLLGLGLLGLGFASRRRRK